MFRTVFRHGRQEIDFYFIIYFCVLHLQGKGGLLFWECSNVNLHANIKGLSEQVEHSNRYFGRNVVPDL